MGHVLHYDGITSGRHRDPTRVESLIMCRRLVVAVIVLSFLAPVLAIAAAGERGRPLALDPAMSPGRYVLERWTIDDGLPQAAVTAIAQTPDGYLWVGLEVGLARFDGVSFRTFDHQNTPGLTDGVYALAVARDGSLWIGSYNGLTVMKDGRFRSFSRADGFPNDNVWSIAERRDGTVWIGTSAGIAVHSAGKFRRYTVADGLPSDVVLALLEDPAGVLWAGTTRGLARLRNGRFEAVSHPLMPKHPISVLVADGPALWIGSKGSGLVRYENGAARRFTTADGLGSDFILSMTRSESGALWIGANGGPMTRYFNGRFTSFGSAEQSTWAIFEDSDGSLWFRDPAGLARFKSPKILTLGTEEGLSGNTILAILQDRSGAVWVGTAGAGLNREVNGHIEKFGKAEGVPGPVILSILERRDGSIWIATSAGMARFDGKRFRPVTGPAAAYSGPPVVSMFEDTDGSLWLGTNGGGALHVPANLSQPLTSVAGLPSTVGDIHRDRRGVLWFATTDGLGRMDGRTLRMFRKEHGLRSNVVSSLEEDSQGVLWLAMWGGGIARVRGDTIRSFSVRDGLPDDNVNRVIPGDQGKLWLATNRGIDAVQIASLDQFERKEIPHIQAIHYGTSEGMRSRECNGGVDPAGWRLRSGAIWFPTMEGVAIVDPRALRIDPRPPPVVIEGVIADNRNLDASGPIEFDSRVRHLQVLYTAISFYSPRDLTFEYQLEGFDNGWIPAGNARTAYYTNVPPGSYRFRVRATNSDGIRNDRGASVPIRVRPRFHESWPFYLLLAVTGAMLLFGVYRWRTRTLRSRQAQLVQLMEERERSAQAIGQSEQHFRSLIENASDMILVVDPAGSIRYASPSAERELGRAGESMTGLPVSGFVHPDDAVPLQSLLLDANEGASAFGTFRIRHRDRTWRSLEAVARRIQGEGAETIVVNCRDVTAQRQLESQLEQANRVASLGRLAATVAHEFNNVLMGISPFAELLRKKLANEPAATSAADQIMKSVKRGRRITEGILRYARPAEPTLRSISTANWIRDVEPEINALTGPAIDVCVLLREPELHVAIDVQQMSQVLTNLVVNARDAMNSSGTLRIDIGRADEETAARLALATAAQFVHIRVSDTGSGIAPDALAHVFEPLFSTKSTGGTGLGLTVAHSVVAAHGGAIFVESEVGHGATFHILLPCSVGDSRTEDVHAPEPPASSGMGPILLVEDDEAVAAGIGALLTSEGIEVSMVHQGREAVSAIRRVQPVAVILDLSLPDIDGLEVYRQIAERWPGLPVIFSTGHGDVRLLDTIDAKAHVGFLRKPYDAHSLIAELRLRTQNAPKAKIA